MSELAVWHFRGPKRSGDEWTLCGIAWPGMPTGVVQPCQRCMDLAKQRRKEARNA